MSDFFNTVQRVDNIGNSVAEREHFNSMTEIDCCKTRIDDTHYWAHNHQLTIVATHHGNVSMANGKGQVLASRYVKVTGHFVHSDCPVKSTRVRCLAHWLVIVDGQADTTLHHRLGHRRWPPNELMNPVVFVAYISVVLLYFVPLLQLVRGQIKIGVHFVELIGGKMKNGQFWWDFVSWFAYILVGVHAVLVGYIHYIGTDV